MNILAIHSINCAFQGENLMPKINDEYGPTIDVFLLLLFFFVNGQLK